MFTNHKILKCMMVSKNTGVYGWNFGINCNVKGNTYQLTDCC